MAKNEIEDLAFWGGDPIFNEIMHVGRPNIGNRESLLRRLNDMLDRRWLTNNGPYVQELEQGLERYLGVKHCILTCNATVALEIGIRALELKGQVIVPSFTFVATAHALQWLGITPVFCDIDPVTHTIDPKKTEALITDQTSGILGVHVWGRACDIEPLTKIAKKRQIKLMFDAAHAFGCSYKDQMLGNFGDLEVFSFHATKFFNTFEGGAIATNNTELAQKVRRLRNFGFSGVDNVMELGTNGKMSEISAAMGLTSLEDIDDFIGVNKRNYLTYQKLLSGIDGVKMVEYDLGEKNNFQYIVVEIDEKEASITRDVLVEILRAENVLVRRYFFPGCHQMEPYQTLYPQAGDVLGETEKLVRKVIQLPTGTAVCEKDIVSISNLIRFIINNKQEVSFRTGQKPSMALETS